MVERNIDVVDKALRGYPASLVEDLRSEGYITLCECALRKFKSDEEFRAYVYKAVKNTFSDYLRKINATKRHDVELNGLYETMEEDSIYVMEFHQFYNELTEKEKRILSRRKSGYTLREIADEFNVGIWNIEYAWNKIKKKYSEYFNYEFS